MTKADEDFQVASHPRLIAEYEPFTLELSGDGSSFMLVQPDGHPDGDACIRLPVAQAYVVAHRIIDAVDNPMVIAGERDNG